jgi:hypothetical protein
MAVVGPNRWLVERQKQQQQQNLPLKGDSSQVLSSVFVDKTSLANTTMLTHRQG